MQAFDLNISPTNLTNVATLPGQYIGFESGTSDGTDQYILIKPNGGNEFPLKPGQAITFPEQQAGWTIKAHDATRTITGRLIIGEGTFDDHNTSNLVTIAASNVPNSAALPVQKQALGTETDFTAASVTNAALSIVNDSTQRILRWRNPNTSGNIALGTTNAVTIANAVVVLGPGDVWVDDETAGMHWYAISDQAGGIPLNVKGYKL